MTFRDNGTWSRLLDPISPAHFFAEHYDRKPLYIPGRPDKFAELFDLDAYYASLVRDRDLSPSSVRHVHAVLRGALGQAVRWGWIPTNPAATASPPKMRHREITPPAIHDTRALLRAADDRDPDYRKVLDLIEALADGVAS